MVKRVAKHIPLSKSVVEATLNYSVKFGEDFQFRKGGKLLGLGPINVITNGEKSNPNGWSVRAMFKPKGKAGLYTYHQNRLGKYGDTEISSTPVFTPGKYSNVSLYVKVNTPAKDSNGILELWVDGKRVSYRNNIQFRAEEGENTLINTFVFQTFHGGSTRSYAPRDSKGNFVTNYAWFDNIEIYEGKHITMTKNKKKD